MPSIQRYKSYLSTTPILATSKEGEDLFLYLAVSEIDVIAVIMKTDEGKQKPVFYTSKMLLDAKTRYNAMEKMVLALVMVNKKLRHNFEAHTVVIMTSYPIRQILSKPDLSVRLTKWAIKLEFITLNMNQEQQKRDKY